MNNILIILNKQLKEIMRTKFSLISLLSIPSIYILFQLLLMPRFNGILDKRYFLNTFSMLFVNMIPLTQMANIISVEKENGINRMLILSGIQHFEYFLGNSIPLYVISLFIICIMYIIAAGINVFIIPFLVLISGSLICSLLLGCSIGISSLRRASTVSLSSAVGLLLSFGPIMSSFFRSSIVEKIYAYNFYLFMRLQTLDNWNLFIDLVVMFVNSAVLFAIFVLLYRKSIRN